jgi:hypothetical protein
MIECGAPITLSDCAWFAASAHTRLRPDPSADKAIWYTGPLLTARLNAGLGPLLPRSYFAR